jgi:hypothetical protein
LQLVCHHSKDFSRRDTRPYGITSKKPDDFLADLHIAFPEALLSSARLARLNLLKTTPTVGSSTRFTKWAEEIRNFAPPEHQPAGPIRMNPINLPQSSLSMLGAVLSMPLQELGMRSLMRTAPIMSSCQS